MRGLILAGAGASRAVGDYPTTVEFYERLPDDIRKRPLFEQLLAFADVNHHPKPLDIEHVLWILAEMRAAGKPFDGDAHPLSFLLRGNRFTPILGSQSDPSIALQLMGRLCREAEGLERKLQELVYRHYGKLPSHDALAGTWLPILSALKESCEQLDIFTTNYDLVLEEAIELSKLSIHHGRLRGTLGTLDVSAWQTDLSIQPKHVGRLTKLHGSVDWWRNGSNDPIYHGNPNFSGDHGRHVILYPGFKGVPTQEPFASFHRYLFETVKLADIIVVIGFAFRDEFINSALASLRSDAVLVVVDPSDKLQIPFEHKDLFREQKRFDVKTANFVFGAIHRGRTSVRKTDAEHAQGHVNALRDGLAC